MLGVIFGCPSVHMSNELPLCIWCCRHLTAMVMSCGVGDWERWTERAPGGPAGIVLRVVWNVWAWGDVGPGWVGRGSWWGNRLIQVHLEKWPLNRRVCVCVWHSTTNLADKSWCGGGMVNHPQQLNVPTRWRCPIPVWGPPTLQTTVRQTPHSIRVWWTMFQLHCSGCLQLSTS